MKKEKVILLETALDHLTGEELGAAMQALSEAEEILDVLYLPGTGKKNRPAGLLQALCLPEAELAACKAIFQHTHTLGLRRQEIERYVLERRPCSVELAGERVRAKSHKLDGREYVRPEADDVIRLARENRIGLPGIRFSLYNIIDKF